MIEKQAKIDNDETRAERGTRLRGESRRYLEKEIRTTKSEGKKKKKSSVKCCSERATEEE